MTHDVFISHSSLDKLAADAVCHGLEARGVRCWMAPRDQIAGKPFGEQITEAIRSAQVMVLVFSEHVNRSQAVLNEIHVAAGANVIIVPFRIASVEFNPELNYYLGRTHWLDAFPQPVDAYIDALVTTIQRNLPQPAEGPAAARVAPAAAPGPSPAAAHGGAAGAAHASARPNYTAVMIVGLVLAFVLVIVLANKGGGRSPARDQAANVVAHAIANAIETGAKDDDDTRAKAANATPAPHDAGGDQ